MRCTFIVFLLLIPTHGMAESFSVWEQDGTIWSMDDAIPGSEWQISRGANCHSPEIDGPVAVWIADWSTPSNVMGRDVTQTGMSDWIIRVGHASDPQVSYLGLPDEWAYAAWREDGGIWAKRLRDRGPRAEEVVPSYAGPYDLDGRMLTWDGGTMELDFPTRIAPEPGTLVLLLAGLLCFAVHRRVR